VSNINFGGLEVQKLTQALQSVKGAGNTFDFLTPSGQEF
jgi:hypothetical protein